jgi:hypothetical protein
MKPAGQQSNYKRKTLLRRRAYKLGRHSNPKTSSPKPKSEPERNQVLDPISLPQ